MKLNYGKQTTINESEREIQIITKRYKSQRWGAVGAFGVSRPSQQTSLLVQLQGWLKANCPFNRMISDSAYEVQK